MNVYLISGLGADKRAFHKLRFSKNLSIHHLDWIKPLQDDSLVSYAHRLADGIDVSKPFVLIGLSFGGMLASEIAQLYRPSKTILLSSVNNCNELPQLYKWAGRNGIYKILPSKPVVGASLTMPYLMGVTRDDDKKMVKQLLADANPSFMKWAVKSILNWNKTFLDEHVVRIHGDNDLILPLTTFKPNYIIPNGGHLIALSHCEGVSAYIEKEIKSI